MVGVGEWTFMALCILQLTSSSNRIGKIAFKFPLIEDNLHVNLNYLIMIRSTSWQQDRRKKHQWKFRTTFFLNINIAVMVQLYITFLVENPVHHLLRISITGTCKEHWMISLKFTWCNGRETIGLWFTTNVTICLTIYSFHRWVNFTFCFFKRFLI